MLLVFERIKILYMKKKKVLYLHKFVHIQKVTLEPCFEHTQPQTFFEVII